MRKTWEVLGAVRSVVIVAIMVLLLVQAGQAEEAEYELLWSYEVEGGVYGVSISSDGSYVAAAGSWDSKFSGSSYNRSISLIEEENCSGAIRQVFMASRSPRMART